MDKPNRPNRPKTLSWGRTFYNSKSTSTLPTINNDDSFFRLSQPVPLPPIPTTSPHPRFPRPPPPCRQPSPILGRTFPSSHYPRDDASHHPHHDPSHYPHSFSSSSSSFRPDSSSSSFRPGTPVRSRYGYLQGFPCPEPAVPASPSFAREREQDVPAPVTPTRFPARFGSQRRPRVQRPSPLRRQITPPLPLSGSTDPEGAGAFEGFSGGGRSESYGSWLEREKVRLGGSVGEGRKNGGAGENSSLQPFDAVTGGNGEGGCLTGVKLGFLMAGLMASVFMISIDRTIISTATPYITQEFKSMPDIGWYGAAHMLTVCAFQPIFGRVFRLFSVKAAFLTAMFVFLLGSMLSGVAHTSMALIIGRAVAGLGSSGILTGSFVIVAKAVPLRVRPVMMSVVGVMLGVGTSLGPVLGGAFTDMLTWRWCFYVNLPIGGAVMLVMAIVLKPWKNKHTNRTVEARLKDLDLVGTVFLLGTFIMLFIALQRTAVGILWRSQETIGLLTGSGVVAVLFVGWQFWKGDDALLPPRIMGKRTVAASCGLGFLTYGAIINITYFLPIWFQAIHGDRAMMSGVKMAPYYAVNTAFTVLAGYIVSVTGYATPPAVIGSAIGTVGLGLFTLLNVESTTAQWVGFEILTSAGFGLSFQQSFTAVQTVLGEDDIAIGTSAVIAAQCLGGAVFLTVGNSVFQSVVRQSSEVDPGAAVQWSKVAAGQLRNVLAVYSGALRMVFMVGVPLGALAAVVSCFIEFRSVNSVPSGNEEGEEGGEEVTDSERSWPSLHGSHFSS